MNVKDGAYWKTVRTADEQRKRVSEKRVGLSTDELEMVFRLLTDPGNVRGEAFSLLRSLEYEETPVPPDQFLEDPYFFGELGKDLYPWIKRDIPRFFQEGFEQAVLTGAQRTGKDTFAHCALAYLIYLIQCMREPATSYGLAKGSSIYIVLMSATQDLAKEVVFSQLVEKMRQSPWFAKLKRKELSDEIRFPKGLVIKGAESADTGVVGLNTCAVVIDEANLGRKIRAVHEARQGKDRMETIYQAIRRRVKTTFFRQGIPPTLLFVIGSRRYPSDFVDRRIQQLAGDEKAMIVDMPLWEAKGRDKFSEKSFRVVIGNETVPSKVLAEGEAVPLGMKTIDVPDDFKTDFEGDCDGALRDIGGVSVRTLVPFFANQDLLRGVVDESRSHPCDVEVWRAGTEMRVDWDKLVVVRDGRVVPIMSPEKPRYVAIDLGRVRNPTGFCVGYVRGYKTVEKPAADGAVHAENLPVFVVEFALRISPEPGIEVRFSQIRDLIFEFIQKGIPIKYAAFDHWQSDNFVELLRDQGIEATQIKTDIKAYDVLKAAIYEGRVKCYPYKPLLDELTMLEYDAKRRKVDTSAEDFGPVHHDVADAVCLFVNGASQQFRALDFEPVLMEVDLAQRRGADLEYRPLAEDALPFDDRAVIMPGVFGGTSAQPTPPQKQKDEGGGSGYGILTDSKEAGWGGHREEADQRFMNAGSQPVVRVEVLAQDFCHRARVGESQVVSADAIKAFLFDQGVGDPRYFTAVRRHIENVHGKTVR